MSWPFLPFGAQASWISEYFIYPRILGLILTVASHLSAARKRRRAKKRRGAWCAVFFFRRFSRCALVCCQFCHWNNRPLSHSGHFESQENKKLCFCPSSLALNERLDGQNLLFQHCVIKFYGPWSSSYSLKRKQRNAESRLRHSRPNYL